MAEVLNELHTKVPTMSDWKTQLYKIFPNKVFFVNVKEE